MSNSDIRLKLSFQTHPKTKKLKLKLGATAPLNFIYLMLFAAASKPDGKLTGMDHIDIALAADYDGDPDQFCEVLLAVKYLDFDGSMYSLHDWADNNPWAAGAADRSEHSRRAAMIRHHGKYTAGTNNQRLTLKNVAVGMNGQCSGHETALQGANNSNAPSPSPSPSPSPIPTPIPKSRSKDCATRGTRLPLDWIPTETDLVFIKTKRPDLNAEEIADEFRDYWTAVPGAKGLKIDWSATWRNKVRNEKRNQTGNRKYGESPADRNADAAEKYFRRSNV